MPSEIRQVAWAAQGYLSNTVLIVCRFSTRTACWCVVYRTCVCLDQKVGQEVSEEEAQEAARKVAIQIIASIKSA